MTIAKNKTFVGELRPSRKLMPAGYRVARLTVSFAYAKNGNTGNPTPKVSWIAYHRDMTIGSSTSEAGAIWIVNDHAANGRSI